MLEILLFLFEHYPQIELAPDRDTLALKLNAAGFQISEIEQVLNWLGELNDIHGAQYPVSLAENQTVRLFTADELHRLDVEGAGFLVFMQQTGIINSLQREWIINQIMALDEDDHIDEKLRWITLVVLWSQHPDQNILLLEDMLFNHNAAPTLH